MTTTKPCCRNNNCEKWEDVVSSDKWRQHPISIQAHDHKGQSKNMTGPRSEEILTKPSHGTTGEMNGRVESSGTQRSCQARRSAERKT